MQIGFIDFVCLPVYVHLSRQLPSLQPMVDNIVTNRKNWEALQGRYQGFCSNASSQHGDLASLSPPTDKLDAPPSNRLALAPTPSESLVAPPPATGAEPLPLPETASREGPPVSDASPAPVRGTVRASAVCALL